MNKNIQKITRVQLTCPKCKYEFQYNYGKLEEKVRNLGIEIQKVTKWLAEFKKLPLNVRLQAKNKKEKSEKIVLLQALRLEKMQLNAQKKLIHDVMDKDNFEILKGIIKEFYGEKEFERCINEMIERGKAYNVQDTMGIDYYSNASGKHIKKI